jgi:glyoxylate reductase
MSKPRVYITRRLPQAAIDVVAAACEYAIWDDDSHVPRDVLLREAGPCVGLLSQTTDKIDSAVLDAAPNLRVVANVGVGYDNVDVATLTARRVLVTNTPGVLTETTADMAFALLMAAARRVVEGQKTIEAGNWKYAAVPLFMAGQDVFGATLGIVGMGRIGSAVARRAKGFDMRVLYHNRNHAANAGELGAQYRELDDLLRESDFVVVTAPLTPQTRGLFGARQFALMKPTAVFVNISRGPTVKEAELYDALRQGRPWAAGLDVFEVEPADASLPLLQLPNVVCTPHCGSSSVATRTRMTVMAAENLVAVLTGKPALTPVNAV